MIFCDFPAFNALFCLLYTKKGIRILLSYPHFLLVDIFLLFTYSHVDNFFYTAQTRLLIFCACFSFILPSAMANITQRANPHRTVIFFIPRIV